MPEHLQLIRDLGYTNFGEAPQVDEAPRPAPAPVRHRTPVSRAVFLQEAAGTDEWVNEVRGLTQQFNSIENLTDANI